MSKARVIESVVCNGANRMHVTVQCGGDNVMVSVCDGVTGASGHWWAFL